MARRGPVLLLAGIVVCLVFAVWWLIVGASPGTGIHGVQSGMGTFPTAEAANPLEPERRRVEPERRRVEPDARHEGSASLRDLDATDPAVEVEPPAAWDFVRGRLLDHRLRPVADARLSVHTFDEPLFHDALSTTRTESDGRFRFEQEWLRTITV